MAVTPTILINQVTLGPGTPNVSRTDGVVGQLVTATDPANAGIGVHVWTLIVPFGSATTLTGAGTPVVTYMPDIAGNYLLFLSVDGVKSWTDNAIGEQISTQGGLGVRLNTKLIGVGGETTQFHATHGWGAGYDEIVRSISGAFSAAQGSIYYADATGTLTALGPGTAGQVLQTQGAGANPIWAAGGGGIGGTTGALDNAVLRADGVGGSTIKSSVVTISDTGAMAGVASIAVSGAVDGRDISVDGALLDSINSGTQGDVLYVNGSSVLAKLGAGTNGQVLRTNGAAANPSWTDAVLDADFTGSYAGRMRRTGAGAYAVLKDNMAASADPTSAADSTQDYSAGSLWLNTSNETYWVCLAPTATEANWIRIGNAFGPINTTDRALATYSGVAGLGAVTLLNNSTATLTAAGALLLADGTSTDPAYSFSGSTEMGVRRSGSSIIVQASSANRYSFSSTGILPSTNGTFSVGQVNNRFKDVYANAVYHAGSAIKVVNSTITINDHVFYSNGVSLNHTLPTAPNDGFIFTLVNLAATSATLTPGGTDVVATGGTIAATSEERYQYIAGTPGNWYRIGT